jgi:hypothetical protein
VALHARQKGLTRWLGYQSFVLYQGRRVNDSRPCRVGGNLECDAFRARCAHHVGISDYQDSIASILINPSCKTGLFHGVGSYGGLHLIVRFRKQSDLVSRSEKMAEENDMATFFPKARQVTALDNKVSRWPRAPRKCATNASRTRQRASRLRA